MKVITFILAGGRGERLYPLTKDRAKPAVPFGAKYRIIDFSLSNCVNSGLRQIYVLTQYKSLSLDRHIQMGWNILNSKIGEFVQILSAQQRVMEEWYRGTADAVYQNIYTLDIERPDLVLILSGDHVYKMDYKDIINYHIRKKADLTVAAVEADRETASEFGVIVVDDDLRMVGFQEKPTPEEAAVIPGKADRIFASMGIYVFNTGILIKRLIEDAKRKDSAHDFGKSIIPGMVEGGDRVYAFNFQDRKKGSSGYWRDVGTIKAYWQSHLDLVEPKPPMDLFDRSWPLMTYEIPLPPAKIMGRKGTDNRAIHNSIIASGCVIKGGRIIRSVISPGVIIEPDTHIEESIILGDARIGRGCKLKRAIVDKMVDLPAGMTVGYDEDTERRHGFTHDPSGITVVPRGMRFK